MPEVAVFDKVKKLISSERTEADKLKVLFVSAEASPFAQVGGVGQVVFYLPKALRKLGVDARVFIPKYGTIDEKKYSLELIYQGLKVPTDDPEKPSLICNVKYYQNEGVPTYFLENREYYELRANVYGYSDDHIRWALLCRGVLEYIDKAARAKINGEANSEEKSPAVRQLEFVPDIIHCNDWHTALVPNYVKTAYSKNLAISKIVQVFTIHNLYFQGMIDPANSSQLDFDDGKSQIPSLFDPRLAKLNFAKRGIIYADIVNTVSETYSREILTEEFGKGLHSLLLELRSKLFGIVNGLDYASFNPATDNLLLANFDKDTTAKRAENKKAVQREFSLPVDDGICMLAAVGRLDHQKGIDLIIDVLPKILRDFKVQFVLVGGGDSGFREALEAISKKFPAQVGLHTYPNFTLPRLVYAGADIFLMPSRFEPAGLTQLEAMRYGSVPVVRFTGGLGDTVEDVDLEKNSGTGFVFRPFDSFAFYGAVVRAITLWQIKSVWGEIVKRAMSADFSWDTTAENYLKLYYKAQDLASGKFTTIGKF